MRNLKLLLAALAMLAAPLAAMPAAAQPQEIEAPEGPWSPDGVDAVFPDEIGDYRRVSINSYGAANWSVGYNLWDGDVLVHSITVYLLTPRGTCQSEMSGSKTALERLNSGAMQLTDGTAAAPSGRPGAALHARYRLPNGFGSMTQAVLSDVYLFCPTGSRFWIKARSTWSEERSALEGGTAEVLHGIKWPAETK
ncbi:MAG: hypothetical protein ACAH11_06250 [Sphingomonas sp.]